VISYDKVSLSTCTFGAGLAHAAALALVLPILITLPAPGTSAPPRLLAIPVTIMPEPPAPAVAKVEDVVSAVVESGDVIGALVARTSVEEPEPVPKPEATVAAPEPAPPPADETTVEASDDVTGALPDEPSTAEAIEEAEPAVAAVDLKQPPLPTRVRRDADGDAVAATPPAPKNAEPAPPRHGSSPAPRRRTVKQDIAPYKGSWEALLGKPAFNPIDKRGQ
jgi:hypothetical protein